MLGNPGQPTSPLTSPSLRGAVDEEVVAGEVVGWVPSMPSSCLRTLHSFRGECALDCPGRQRDGGCLLDVVRAANEAGVEWRFEVDPRDGVWDYAGPPLTGDAA